jgi:proteasome lid subunit RPN8/RPN11
MSEPESNVRLSPRVETIPRSAELPSTHVLRWQPPFDDDSQPLVSVFVTSQAFVRINAHCGTDLDNEVGGGLVGDWRIDPRSGGQFIVIDAVLPAQFTRQGSAFLTFTQDTLVAMNDQLDERYPEKRLVGWYHTHPRMGIFLSQYDLWLHDHFFPEYWQVALVIEPHSITGGFFIRQAGERMDKYRYFGFHEIMPVGKSSVVHWANLHAPVTRQENKGEYEDE